MSGTETGGRMNATTIVDLLRQDGFRCTVADVRVVLDGGSLDDAALESAILQAMDR